MGQNESSAAVREDVRTPLDERWPIVGPAANQHRILFVKGMPYFVEESSIAPNRTFSIRGTNQELFIAYWNAFERDYGKYIDIMHLRDGAPHISYLSPSAEWSIVFRMKADLAAHAHKWFKY